MANQQSVIGGEDVLSQADIILPSQYFATIGSKGMSGEQRLMVAVIVDAINVLQSWKGTGSPRKRRNFGEAAQWVNTRGTLHPFSFDSVCDALGIDSELLRSRLRAFTVEPAASRRRPPLAHLRLKELSRSQQMTAKARRPSENIAGMMAPTKSRRSRPFRQRAVHVEPVQKCS